MAVNKWGETAVTSVNFVRASQTITNKHMSSWPGTVANSLSEV